MDILYSAKFSRVFNFVNFQPFAKLFQRKFVTCNTCNSVDGQHAVESTRDALQRDTSRKRHCFADSCELECGQWCGSVY